MCCMSTVRRLLPTSEASAKSSAVLPLHCHTGIVQRQALHRRRQRVKVCIADWIQTCTVAKANMHLHSVCPDP